MVISHNMSALNAQRQFNMVSADRKKSVEKLSSGYRINRAADDAAGLSISEKMRSQVRALNRNQDNLQDGISFAQTADGALEQSTEILQRINELSVQSANGTLSPADRAAIDAEVKQLTAELNRIFSTTTFNGKNIWGETAQRDIVERIERESVVPSFSGYNVVDNYSMNKLPANNYFETVATNTGVKLTWTAFDGTSYASSEIPYADLTGGQSFRLSDYMDPASDLFKGGKMVFDYSFSFDCDTMEYFADGTDAAANYPSKYMDVLNTTRFYITNNTPLSTSLTGGGTGVSAGGVGISNEVLYNLGFDFVSSDSVFIEPNLHDVTVNGTTYQTNQTAAAVDGAGNVLENTPWKFSFKVTQGQKDAAGNLVKQTDASGNPMTSIVEATCTGMTYYCGNRGAQQGLWWYKGADGRDYSYTRSVSNGTIASVRDCLTGTKDSNTPGLLSPANGGAGGYGGNISLNFSIAGIGSFNINVSVYDNDTEDSVIQRINSSLNGVTTRFDINSNKNASTRSTSQSYWTNYNGVTLAHDIPTTEEYYVGTMDMNIQSGPETAEYVHMKYRNMHTSLLGLDDLSLSTQQGALRGIDQVSEALQMVSEERSAFGAYQNRLEHAKEIDAIAEENTTHSESVIRDTDMAKEMVNNARMNILSQFGQSMMAQCNQSKESVLGLLQ